MVDVAKCADLVLLAVDAHFGFEMETFEFLNILKVHGSVFCVVCLFVVCVVFGCARISCWVCSFPKVLGVLTHLDMFPDNKKLNNTKRKLKHRFWTEICDGILCCCFICCLMCVCMWTGAKLFYLSGLVNNKWYPKREVLNLARFISVQKIRPIVWRASHPYVLTDRSVCLCFRLFVSVVHFCLLCEQIRRFDRPIVNRKQTKVWSNCGYFWLCAGYLSATTTGFSRLL